MKIDARILRLYKLHIPKTNSFSDIIPKKSANHNYYFTMGHYDVIDIEKVDYDDKDGFLSAVHSLAYKHDKENPMLVDICTSQKIFVFADESDFSVHAIDDFWNHDIDNKSHNEILFVSMLHIQDVTPEQNIDINIAIAEINKIYKGSKFIYYFTFDYSDIIIFYKGNSVSEYLDKVNRINYESEKYCIRDSFTLYCLCRSTLLDRFKELDSNKQKKYKRDVNNNFFAKFNIGVQNYKSLEKLVKEMHDIGLKTNSTIFINQLGRHDFSIINPSADLNWLIYVEYLIDRYTTLSSKTDINFTTFEVFIGSEYKAYMSVARTFQNTTYVNSIYNKCQQFKKALLKLNNSKSRDMKRKHLDVKMFYAPMEEVTNSIASILKNGFAEDFVLCMYESFYRFIEYLTQRIDMLDKDDASKEKFTTTFNEYFKGLAALANSGMHSDRSFIQATAFNAIFYDIPPKFMAFYTALVYRLISIMKDVDKYNYSFLFTPNFSDNISVKTISYDSYLRTDRLFVVSINESFFYNPHIVLTTMTHEIAHFAGDKKRNRDHRKLQYLKCVVYNFCANIFPEDSDIDDVTKKIYERIHNIIKLDCLQNDVIDNYDELDYAIMSVMETDPIIHSYIIEHSDEMYFLQASDQVDAVSNIEMLSVDLSYITKTTNDIVKSVLRESYADLQMILMWKMSQSEYLKKIFYQEHISDENLKAQLHIARVAIICLVMYTAGIWKLSDLIEIKKSSHKGLIEVFDLLSEFINDFYKYIDIDSLRTNFENIRQKAHRFYELENVDCDNQPLYTSDDSSCKSMFCYATIFEYIMKCLDISLDEYLAEKENEIKNVNKIYEEISNFDNIHNVYTTIREVIENYKRRIISLN